MIRSIRVNAFAGAGLLAAGLVFGLFGPQVGAAEKDQNETAHATAVANIHGAGANKDKINGTVTFVQATDGVEVLVEVTGLSPGKHGIHIHEKTDLSDPELKGAGGHWNPEGHKHGAPNQGDHHAGDLGNITADDKGVAKAQMTIRGVAISGEKNGVVGHSVIIHEKEDDMKTDPAGNSGTRIAGGVIELKVAGQKTEKPTPK